MTAENTGASDVIRFVLDGSIVSLRNIDPTRTVLQYLREDLRRIGTKEGCAEGDCGACTVVIAELNDGGDSLHYRAINSCIQFLPTLDGKALLTVESLAGAGGNLHPVQRAMVDSHGSQCGFCTPGFVMSLYAFYKTGTEPTRREIDKALAGNLCRCTGYRPIVQAAQTLADYDNPEDHAGEQALVDLLRTLQPTNTVALTNGTKRYFAPTTLDELCVLSDGHHDAHLLAGGTDIGLWVTKQHRDLDITIYIGNVQELQHIRIADDHLVIGAATTLTRAVPAIVEHYPDLEELFERFASPPIRNAATLVGNIANGSPIGDAMPVLIVLGTTLTLRAGNHSRALPLQDFYLGYQQTALQPGEFVEAVHIPLPSPALQVRSYKISKRFDQDISAVCGAFAITLDGDKVQGIRVAYGGMAAIPERATQCERTLHGKNWDEPAVQAGMIALNADYTPLTDMRAGSAYRTTVARNLLYRFWLETTGQEKETRLYDYGR